MESNRKYAWVLVAAGLVAGCAQGETDPPGPPTLPPGEYELTTLAIDDACPVQGAISPGIEYIGKVARVGLEPHHDAVTMEVCDPFFDRSCMPTFDAHYTWSALHRGTELVAGATSWLADCFCFDEIAGTRSMTGEVTAQGEAEITWTVTLPELPLDCDCEGVAACTASVEQVLSLR